MAYGIEGARLFALFVLPAIIGCSSVAVCVLLVRRMKQLHLKVVSGEEELRIATATWTRGLTAVGKEIETIETTVKHTAKHSGGDLSASAVTRRKVLKMHRLGSSVEQIARTLRLTKGEVMLVLKVHTIILRPFEQAADAENSSDGTKTLKVLV